MIIVLFIIICIFVVFIWFIVKMDSNIEVLFVLLGKFMFVDGGIIYW